MSVADSADVCVGKGVLEGNGVRVAVGGAALDEQEDKKIKTSREMIVRFMMNSCAETSYYCSNNHSAID